MSLTFVPHIEDSLGVRSVVECHFYSSIIGHNVIHRDVGHTLGWFHLYFKIYEKAEYWPEQIVHGEKNLNVKSINVVTSCEVRKSYLKKQIIIFCKM